MKIIFNITLVFSAIFFLNGCAMVEAWDEQHDAKMRKYVGMHYSSYVAKFGNPQHRAPDGKGGEVLVWKFKTEYTYAPATSTTNTNIHGLNSSYASGSANKYANSVYANAYGLNSTNANIKSQTTYNKEQTSVSIKTRTFYVNSRGIIYNYHWDGYSFGEKY